MITALAARWLLTVVFGDEVGDEVDRQGEVAAVTFMRCSLTPYAW